MEQKPSEPKLIFERVRQNAEAGEGMKRIFSAKGIVFNEKGEVALVRTKDGRYGLPGGKVIAGREPRAEFEREVLEETGRNVREVKEMGIAKVEKQNGELQIMHLYVAHATGSEQPLKLSTGEKSKGMVVVWIPLEDAIKALKDEHFENTASDDAIKRDRDMAVLKEIKQNRHLY